HAACLRRFRNERRHVLIPHAISCKGWNSELLANVSRPGNSVLGGGVPAPREHARHFLVTAQRSTLGRASTQGTQVNFHPIGQDGRANGAMRRVELTAQGSSESVYDAQAGVGERQSAEQRRERHIAPRVRIIALV